MKAALCTFGAVLVLMSTALAGTLHDAVEAGNLQLTQEILATDLSQLDQPSDSGDTPLYIAAYYGHSDLARLLLDKGAGPNAPGVRGSTPLHAACFSAHSDIVDLLLQAGANPLAVTSRGVNPLHSAASGGDTAIVEKMLALGNDVNGAPQSTGRTPLHLAAAANHLDAVRTLLAHGAAIDRTDANGGQPLHSAAARASAPLIDLLMAHGANLEAVAGDGSTPIMWAAWTGNVETVRALIRHGANVHHTVEGHWTALHSAARNGHVALIDPLVAAGLSINAANQQNTPLQAALQNGQLVFVRALIERGVDVTARDAEGSTLLHTAAWGDNIDLLRMLVEAGLDPNTRDNFGNTPICFALRTNNRAVVEYLLEAGTNLTDVREGDQSPISFAVMRDDIDLLNLLLSRGADPKAIDEDGHSLLWQPTLRGASALVDILIDKGLDLNTADTHTGRTVLHVAAIKGYADLAATYLAHGAEVNAVDAKGHAPLYYAGKYGHQDVAELLETHGATAAALERNYGTPPQLSQPLNPGEADIWYLGHVSFAISTQNHFMIFDYCDQSRQPLQASLANGHINPAEIKDKKVTVFVTHEHGDHYDTSIFAWRDQIPDITYVYGFRPEALPQHQQAGYHGPAYEAFAGRQHRTVNGLDITTITANDAGVGYLIKADGLTIYHAGDHAGWAEGQRQGYLDEIDFLATQAQDIDLAFLNVTGCHAHDTTALAEGTWYTLEQLRPRAWFPTHALDGEFAYETAAERARGHVCGENIQVPDCRGDHFSYRREGLN